VRRDYDSPQSTPRAQRIIFLILTTEDPAHPEINYFLKGIKPSRILAHYSIIPSFQYSIFFL